MGRYRGLDTDEGWIARRFADLERRFREFAAARSLESSTIGKGGIRVDSGGSIRVVGDDTILLLAPDSVNMATLAPDGVTWVTPNMVILPEGFVAADGVNTISFKVDAATHNAILASANQNLDLPANVRMGLGGITRIQGVTYLPGLGTTATGANVNWSLPNGELKVVTSTERHKNVLGPSQLDPDAVLELADVLYTRKDDPSPKAPAKHVGFIAERAHELGLTQFVIYDEDDLPWSFDYVTFAAVAHQVVLRKHRDELAAQEKRIAALEEIVLSPKREGKAKS